MGNLNIRLNDRRERRLANLCDATGETAKSKAVDTAADYYLKMKGDTTAVPTGAVEQLLAEAEENGCLTVEEIAEILHTDELPIQADVTWAVGQE